MGFTITYQKLLTLRCWHPEFLRSVANLVPIAPATPLTLTERNDYLAYDVRRWLEIRPTEAGLAMLRRSGLIWTPSTLGGWLLANTTYVEADPSVRLQLGVYVRDPDFAAATNFGVSTVAGRLFHLTNANAGVVPEYDLTGGNLRDVHYAGSQNFSVTLPQLAPGTDSQVQVRDPLVSGNPVLRTVSVAGSAPDPAVYSVDLSGLPAGLYRFTGLHIDNINLLVGFTGDPALLGVIDLRLADWSGAACDLNFQSF